MDDYIGGYSANDTDYNGTWDSPYYESYSEPFDADAYVGTAVDMNRNDWN